MSKEFVKDRVGLKYIQLAYEQQKQLSYFTESKIQEDITIEYLKQWAQRNYRGNDYFLNWVKSIFRTQNFISFFKYLRYPLPSSKLVNDEIKPQLRRVYFADDSYFRYVVKKVEYKELEELCNERFESEIFNALLFRYNDVIIHDLEDINKPYREIICIKDVVSIESCYGVIERIAYKARLNDKDGYLFMDKENYIFYDLNYVQKTKVRHDLKRCPATWISNENFYTDNDIIKKSIFSYNREELEEFVFLKTLLKMTEPNGALPVTVKLKSTTKGEDGNDFKGLPMEPMASNEIGSQKAEFGKDINFGEGSVLQAGTTIEIPQKKKLDHSIDTDLVQNFLKQFYIPVESLTYINERIKEIERSIIANVLGDYQQNNDSAKNENQINASTHNKQDKLRNISLNLSYIRNNSDLILLGLKYGIDNVNVNVFYGSDFFIDNEYDLYDLFNKVPNQIERRNILNRIGKTKYRFNPERAERETLLYSLLPFVSDKDFDKALSQNIVDEKTKQFQLRFDYWISMFEAKYGDIVLFYESISTESKSEKLILINNMLEEMIPTTKEAILPQT